MPSPIRYGVADHVATLTIDRPEKKGAMTYAMLAEFVETVRRAGDEGSPFSQQRIKALVYGGLERGVAEQMRAHVGALKECFASEDHRESVRSFLERRPARFVGR